MKLYYARYQRKFTSPLVYGDRSLDAREGIALRFESKSGVHYSEASPLPGHSREDIDRVEAILAVVGGTSLLEAVEANAPVAEDLPPSLRFGLEGLVLERSQKWKSPVRSNALVPWIGAEKTKTEILRKYALGYDSVKLKIFSESVPDLLELISSLPSSSLRLRLDANRALTEPALHALFRGLEKSGADRVEYLEEPFAHWRHPLLTKAPVPLAADECAADPRFWPALLQAPAGGPAVFVLKPTVGGGLGSLARKARMLADGGKKVVYGSSFEAEPGRRALLRFLSLEAAETAGVATGFLFAESFLTDRPLWETLPGADKHELSWLENLAWKQGQ